MNHKKKKMKQNHTESESPLKKKDKIMLIIAVLVMLVIVIAGSVYIWQGQGNAQAVFDFIGLIIAVDITGILVPFVTKKKILAGIPFILLLGTIILCAEASVAKENLPEETVSEPGPTDSVEQKKWYEEFIWEDDIFILSWASYCDALTEEEAINMLVEDYAMRYLEDDSELIIKSESELNSGPYGQYINAAVPAETALKGELIDEAKVDYINIAIKWKEKADLEYEAYDNKKILGDLYIEKADLLQNDEVEKLYLLETALKYYIKALPLSYWAGAENDYITSIWEAIRDTYKSLGEIEYGLDQGHKDRIPSLANACERWCDT